MNGINFITAWRRAVMAYLAEQFPTCEVVGGNRTGVSRDRDRIAVFWPAWPELARDVSLATPTLTIRYWPARSKQPGADATPDPEPLEAAGVALMAAFEQKRKAGDFVENLACRLSSLASDEDEWKVEATLQAFTLNLAGGGA